MSDFKNDHEFLTDIRTRAAEHHVAERATTRARRAEDDAHTLLMDAIHHARCAGIRWRQIAFAECRARGLTPGCATMIEARRRKELCEYRRARGLEACGRAA